MADSRWKEKTIIILGVGALVGFGTCTTAASNNRLTLALWAGGICLFCLTGMIVVSLIALGLLIAERFRR